ncbi:MAG: serine hydrolase [Bacteroidales bacterium]|nr:serine hydrolase [Bacteroidales bacterium]
MKIRILKSLLMLPVVFALSSCHVGRFFIYNYADIKDYRKFPQVVVQNPDNPWHFSQGQFETRPTLPGYLGEEYGDFDSFLDETGSMGFLVIRNDSILFEHYGEDYDESSVFTSFSVAKSFVSAMVGIAVEKGYISSVHEPITKWLPELKGEGFDRITVEHLLNMRSGIFYREAYSNPFMEMPKYYYGRNLLKYVKKLKIKEDPGQNFDYISVNSLLLSLIIERSSGKRLNEFLEMEIWKPIGMEFPATLNTDSKKHDTFKGYCCVNARARDFAKFGRLYLNKGNWNGKQIVPEDWVHISTTFIQSPQLPQGFHYTYQWRVMPSGSYMARGILGQFIYCNPAKNIIIVRLGKKVKDFNWAVFFEEVAGKY